MASRNSGIIDSLQLIAVVISILTVMYCGLWSIHWLISEFIAVTGLAWLVKLILFASFGATAGLIYSERQEWKEAARQNAEEDENESSVL